MLTDEREREIRFRIKERYLAPDKVELRAMVHDLLDEIDRLRSPWIPVGERLPVRGQRVLAVFDEHPTCTTIYNLSGHGEWRKNNEELLSPPTYWVPLPSLPEGD